MQVMTENHELRNIGPVHAHAYAMATTISRSRTLRLLFSEDMWNNVYTVNASKALFI